jgi:hypothetical protein
MPNLEMLLPIIFRIKTVLLAEFIYMDFDEFVDTFDTQFDLNGKQNTLKQKTR